MEDSTNLHYSFLTFPPGSVSHISSPEMMEQWNQCICTRKRKGCLATYSICLWPLLQSHWLGGVSNAAEHRQVGGIHALSSSRQEHSYLKSQALILALQHFHQSLNTRAEPSMHSSLEPCTHSKIVAFPWFLGFKEGWWVWTEPAAPGTKGKVSNPQTLQIVNYLLHIFKLRSYLAWAQIALKTGVRSSSALGKTSDLGSLFLYAQVYFCFQEKR